MPEYEAMYRILLSAQNRAMAELENAIEDVEELIMDEEFGPQKPQSPQA